MILVFVSDKNAFDRVKGNASGFKSEGDLLS